MKDNDEQIFATQPFQSQKQINMTNPFNALLKIKQLKNHAKQLKNYHQRALSERVRTQKSIGQITRSAQKTKVSFLKLYENKKIKLTNRQKVQTKKTEDREHLRTVKRKVKQQKLMDELQMEATRNEEDSKNETRKQQLMKQKQKVHKQIKLNRLEQYMNSRSQYVRLKEHKSQIMARNKKMTQIMEIRGKYNYAEKAERQMEQVKAYEKLLDDLCNVEKQQGQFRPYTAFSKSFFITNNLTQVQKTEQKPVSTRGTYRAARSRHR